MFNKSCYVRIYNPVIIQNKFKKFDAVHQGLLSISMFTFLWKRKRLKDAHADFESKKTEVASKMATQAKISRSMKLNARYLWIDIQNKVL